MARMIECQKLGIVAEGLDYVPFPSEIGKRIYECISKQAWQNWLSHQTLLINEYRLNLIEPNAQQFLDREMEKFLFGGEVNKPSGFVDPNQV